MSPIDFFTWFVLLLTIASVVGFFVFLGLWPIKVAESRQHPQLDAIRVGSWVALIAGFAFWPLVLIWAYSQRPIVRVVDETGEGNEVGRQLRELEQRIERLEAGEGETS